MKIYRTQADGEMQPQHAPSTFRIDCRVEDIEYDPATTTCTGLMEVGTDLVECDNRAEWLVGSTPACSVCIATFVNDDCPTVIVPITGQPTPPITDCLAHRCEKHLFVQPLNANEDGAECGACIVSEWQPMETAPLNGREVLLLVERRAGIPGCMLVGHFMPGGHGIEDHPPIDRGWYFWNGCRFDGPAKPIGWMPLPVSRDELVHSCPCAACTASRDGRHTSDNAHGCCIHDPAVVCCDNAPGDALVCGVITGGSPPSVSNSFVGDVDVCEKQRPCPDHPPEMIASLESQLTSAAEVEAGLRADLEWLGDRVRDGVGAVTFCMTEDGDIGVFMGDSERSVGRSDEVIGALRMWREREPWLGLDASSTEERP